MSKAFEENEELTAAKEPEVMPAGARDVSDEQMQKNASDVTAEEFLAFAERVKKNMDEVDSRPPFTAVDIVKDVIFFVVVTAVAYGWMLLMQLIISFVTLGYIHMEFNTMLWVSGGAALGVAIYYIIVKLRKYNGLDKAYKSKRKE